MNFLVDAQLPPSLCAWLRSKGHQATHVMDVGLLAATDRAIAAKAVADGLILVSKDEDFVILLMSDGLQLLWLRIGNATNRALVAWLAPRWAAVEAALGAGERFVEVR